MGSLPTQIPIVGDVVSNLSLLVPLIKHAPREEWFEMIRAWKEKWPFTYAKNIGDGGRMKPQEVVEELDRQVTRMGRKGETVITTGVGQHQMWAAQHYRWTHPRALISSGGLGVREFILRSVISLMIDP